MMKCFKCGNIINDGIQYCPECGCRIEQNCKNCGAILSDKDKFCPTCGQKRIIEPKNTEEQYMEDQEEVPSSFMDRIINSLLSIWEINGLTKDTYRNGLVKKVFVYYVAVLMIMISALCLAYRVYEESDFFGAVIAFFLIMIFSSITAWIFKFGKCEENLKKYDIVLKEAGKQSAIMVIENSTTDGRTGCLVTCMLILVVLVLMSFC